MALSFVGENSDPLSTDVSLLAEARANLNRTRDIYDATGYRAEYALNTFWGSDNMRSMLSVIDNGATATEVVRAVDRTWMFSVNTPEPVAQRAVEWLLAEQKRRGIDLLAMSELFQESAVSEPRNNVMVNGRRLTPDFVRCVNLAQEIKRLCLGDTPCPAIIELGAGSGHLARVLTHTFGSARYVIVDLPETLFFSFLFLRTNFPQAKTLYVHSSDRLSKEELDSYDFVFVPTLFADAILNGSFDLFVNTASMGEMRNEVIRHWMDFVQEKLDVRHLFTLNRYLNTIASQSGRHDWRLSENEASVHYDAGWEVLNWEAEPSFTRCPYVDTIIARYVEIALKRVGGPRVEELRAAALRALEGVTSQDWIRLGAVSAVMTARDNILVTDTTMNGTLFKLWDGARFCPTNPIIVGFMLHYLETLNRTNDIEFEEVPYYEDLFERLTANAIDPWAVAMLPVIQAKRAWRRQMPQSPPSYGPPPTGGVGLTPPYPE